MNDPEGRSYSLIPTVDETSTGQGLRNRHTLLLTTGNSANASVSDEGLSGVAKAKDGYEDIGYFLDKLVSCLTLRSGVGRTSLGGEPDRFLDGQGREMNVVLWGVLDVAAIMSGDLFGGKGIIVNIALDVVVGITLVCEHLEESSTSGSWTAQNDWVGGS